MSKVSSPLKHTNVYSIAVTNFLDMFGDILLEFSKDGGSNYNDKGDTTT